MADFDRTNRGVLFINDRKERDNQPDRTGSINIEGVEYFLDGWIKDGSKGKFLSLSVKRKDKQPTATAPTPTPSPAKTHGDRKGGPNNRPDFDDMDSDVPF
jgi:hypothetical protein